MDEMCCVFPQCDMRRVKLLDLMSFEALERSDEYSIVVQGGVAERYIIVS